MNSATHQFVLRIPIELWQCLEQHCERRGITAFILDAIEDGLEDKIDVAALYEREGEERSPLTQI